MNFAQIYYFLFQSHIDFNILTHFLNTNFEILLLNDAGFALKKVFLLIIKANAKNWGFFLFSFFFQLTDPSDFEKKLCSQK